MGLFGPTTGGASSTNASIVLTQPDSRTIVTSATANSVFLIPISGEVEVATNGTAWSGSRTFVNCATASVNLRINSSITGFLFLAVGETATLFYSGGNTFSGSSVAINHAQVRWTGSSTIPAATTSAAGLMSTSDKLKLNGLGGSANSAGIASWSIVSGTITVNCSASHFCNTGTSVTISGSGGIDGVYNVASTPTGTQLTITPFTPPANATGTGGVLIRGGEMTRADKQKLDGIASGAQVNVKPDWNASAGNAAEILNKPTIPAAPVNADWNSTTGLSEVLNKPLTPILLGHSSFSYAAGGNTRYFAQIFDLSAVTTLAERNFRVPQNCTIKAAIFTAYNGGAGTSAGHSGGTLRLRNKTANSAQDLLTFNLDGIASQTLGTFTATGLSLTMNAGDDYVIEQESGTFTTAPSSVRQMLTLYY